jgi:hypothetical protein
MPISVETYVTPKQTIIVLEPDATEDGPYLPLSAISAIGAALIQAANTAAARQAIGAAARGINRDITQIQGMAAADSVSNVVTPAGLVSLSNLAAAMGIWGGTVRTVTAATVALASDGAILANTDGGAFVVTIPRALGQAGATKTLVIAKTGETQIPLVLQDDTGTPLPLVLINGGTAFAFVAIIGGAVFAFGVQ